MIWKTIWKINVDFLSGQSHYKCQKFQKCISIILHLGLLIPLNTLPLHYILRNIKWLTPVKFVYFVRKLFTSSSKPANMSFLYSSFLKSSFTRKKVTKIHLTRKVVSEGNIDFVCTFRVALTCSSFTNFFTSQLIPHVFNLQFGREIFSANRREILLCMRITENFFEAQERAKWMNLKS